MRLSSVISPIIFCIGFWSVVDSWSIARYHNWNVYPCPSKKCNNDTKITTSSNISGCACDLQCHLYGDCCQDAPRATNMSLTSLPVVNCTSIPSIPYSIYTISWCPSSVSGVRATYCQWSSNYMEQTSNPQSKVPVTDPSTNITYGNIACARCHSASSFSFWSMNLTCPSHNETVHFPRPNLMNFLNDRPSRPNKFHFNHNVNSWQFTNEKNQKENCTWIPVPPNSTTYLSLRRCETNVVSDCGSLNTTPPSACPGYVAYVTAGGKYYRNVQCANCNNKRENIFCQRPSPQTLRTPIATLVRPGNRSTSTSTRATRSSPPYPTNTRITIPVTTALNTSSSVATSSSAATSSSSNPPSSTPSKSTPPSSTPPSSTPSKSTPSSAIPSSTVTSTFTPSTSQSSGERVRVLKNKTRAYMYIQFNADCKRILNQMNITRVVAETVYYQTMNRTYVTDTKKIVGTTVEVCDMTKKVPQTAYYYEYYVAAYRWFAFTYIVYAVFICASALSILIYLCSYAMSKVSSTVYAKALASFAFILFLAHLGSILNSILTLTNAVTSRLCLLHFLLAYYGHLAARFWLVSIAFEVTACMWEIGSGVPSTSSAESRWTRFTAYSWLSWLVPALIVGTRLCFRLNTFFADVCSIAYDVDFHRSVVSLSTTVSVSMTTALYSSSFYVIRTQSEALEKLSKEYGIDFGLYTILTACAVLMNLTNLGDSDLPILPKWFLFCTLNSMLAISICLHSYSQNALLNNLKLCVNKYFKRLIL